MTSPYYFFLFVVQSRSTNEPILRFFFVLSYILTLALPVQAQHPYWIAQDALLHFLIERAISHEGRALINLDQPGLSLNINKNIEAKYLVAQAALKIMRFIHPVDACNLAEASYDCLNSQFFDLLPTFSPTGHIIVFLRNWIHVSENRGHWAFVASVVLAGVLFEVLGVFVDSIIGEVHE